MIDLDITTPLGMVRLNIGDAEGEFISDEVIDALLAINMDNVYKTTVSALRAIKADLAKRYRCESGDREDYEHQIYEHYCQLLEDFLRDPAFQASPALFKFGGTIRSEVECLEDNRDIIRSPLDNDWLRKQDYYGTNGRTFRNIYLGRRFFNNYD